MSDRLLRFATSTLEKRVSRRGFLVRSALAGSALTVAPLRYLMRPVSASTVVTCADCSSSSRCCDGWTAFCCTLNDGMNACPSYSYMAGWWKCTNYTGNGACSKEGVRYYIDCNRTPTSKCPGGCRCAKGRCRNRRTCCNRFRYGQCNTHIEGVTEVVCRIVKCVNPCQLYVNCNCTQKVENATCSHEPKCV